MPRNRRDDYPIELATIAMHKILGGKHPSFPVWKEKMAALLMLLVGVSPRHYNLAAMTSVTWVRTLIVSFRWWSTVLPGYEETGSVFALNCVSRVSFETTTYSFHRRILWRYDSEAMSSVSEVRTLVVLTVESISNAFCVRCVSVYRGRVVE